jgi:hypothetical protein
MFSSTQTQRNGRSSRTRLRRSRSSSKLTLPLVLILLLTSCATGFARASQQPKSKRSPIADSSKAIAELSIHLDNCQLNLQHVRRQYAFAEEQGKLDAEAIRLRDQKLALLDLQLNDTRQALNELKLAGVADEAVIQALKEQTALMAKEIRALKVSGWLQSRLGLVLAGAALVIGFLLGSKQ